jgi:hypothetical protein
VSNAVLRHINCERECHELYKHGNPEEGRYVKEKRRDGDTGKLQRRRSKMPCVQRKTHIPITGYKWPTTLSTALFRVPNCYFRPINANRLVPTENLASDVR